MLVFLPTGIFFVGKERKPSLGKEKWWKGQASFGVGEIVQR